MNLNMKKAVSLVMSTVLMLSVLLTSGCSGGTEKTEKTANGKVHLTIFAHEWQQYDGVDKDRVWEEIEKKTGVTFELTGTPFNNYTDRLNTMVNTGEAPDIFFYPPGSEATYQNWVKQGLITSLDDYLKDDSTAPNIKKIFSYSQYKNLKNNGHYTQVPWLCEANNWGIYIRKDWLDNLHLAEPKTLDDYYNVMKAFTFNDPDKNGKNDTVGLTGAKGIYWFMPFYAAFVKKPDWNWNADKTKIEYFYATNGYKEYLKWMHKAYADGLISKEYYTYPDDKKIEEFKTGKAGILVQNAAGFTQDIMDNTLKANPNAKVIMGNPPAGADGKGYMHGWGGTWGGYSISANCKHPKEAVKLLDFLVGEEGTMLRYYGIKDVHYTLQDGKVVPNIDERSKEPEGRFGLIEKNGVKQPLGSYSWGTWFGTLRKFGTDSIELKEDYNSYKYADLCNQAAKVVSETLSVSDMNGITVDSTEFADISKKVKDLASIYTTNIIVGKMDIEAGWTEYMAKLKEAGYDKACGIATDTMKKLN